MRVVFAGTPAFAVRILQGLVANKDVELVGVVTQPDKPQGRKGTLTPSAVKEYALGQGLAVYQPVKIKSPEFVEVMGGLKADVMVVAAYGQILSEEILHLPRFGCINVHGSLLPKYRGAAPAQFAILNGEKESGVTIMQMDRGMDTGAMLAKAVVPITENMTSGELLEELAEAGDGALRQVLALLGTDSCRPAAQNEDEATYAHLLKREMERIEWVDTAQNIHNKIRAFSPEPGAYTFLPNGKQLKIWQSVLAEGSGRPGEVLAVEKKSFVVAAGEGALRILQVQPAGKKQMPAGDFLNSRAIAVGDVLQ